jgi:hypothetical protein
MGIAGDLVSNGFIPRNRLNTGFSLKSLVGVKNFKLLDAILEAGGHTRWLGESYLELDNGVLRFGMVAF